MTAHTKWLTSGFIGNRSLKLASALLILGGILNTTCPAQQAYVRSIEAEKSLDLFDARNHFRQAIQQQPQRPGLREHVAWFLYRNGFHDRGSLSMLEEIQPTASQPEATAQAIRHLRSDLGLAPPTPRVKSDAKISLTTGSSPVARLQRARELYWSGSTTKSRNAYQELINEYPDKAALRWELSKVLVSRKQYRDAAEQLSVARQLQPKEPEIILAQADVEALLGNRTKATMMLDGLDLDDPAPMHLVRAHAYHYSGEFIPAAREYRKVLESRPHHEGAAHGLAECSLRTNSIPEAKDILRSWAGVPHNMNWSDRYELDYQMTAPRLRTAASYFENSQDYETWSVGADLHMRPIHELEIGLAATHGWFRQPGFDSIERNTAQLTAHFQNNGFWAVYGSIGVNDYDNDWTSLTGGGGIMIRPLSSLEFNISASHLDVVDSEPPLGISLYDLASTIGAAAGKATMDSLSASVKWQPIENIELFAKYRMATLEGDNTLDDAYAEIACILLRDPMVRAGYGVAYLTTEDPSPVYTEGPNITSYYYDPDNLVVHNLFISFSRNAGKSLSYGSELHLYLQPDNDATGVGLFGYVRYTFNDHHAVQMDARYYTQNRGRNRDQSSSGHYDAFNLVAVYEYRF